MSAHIDLSVVIPCRNEERYIAECLDSLLAAEFPKETLEVLVVDGMSSDGTRVLLKKYAETYPFIRLLENPRKITPVGMNIGIKEARGMHIMILSSHSKVSVEFLAKNLSAIKNNVADCVGGILVTIPGKETLVGQAIAMALAHPFGVGNSYFRIGTKDARYVDTVPFGCYRREVFQTIGFFDEYLVRNQDDEFNLRLIKNGGKVLLVPDIVSYYYARTSLGKLWRMYYQYGMFKPLVSQKVGNILTIRQLVPALFVGLIITSSLLSLVSSLYLLLFMTIAVSYTCVNVLVSLLLALKRGPKYFVILPLVFATLHVSYGLAYLKGIVIFVILKRGKKTVMDVPLTR